MNPNVYMHVDNLVQDFQTHTLKAGKFNSIRSVAQIRFNRPLEEHASDII